MIGPILSWDTAEPREDGDAAGLDAEGVVPRLVAPAT